MRRRMQRPPVVLRDKTLVANRLSELGLSRAELLEVVQAAMAGRNSTVLNDPIGSPGNQARMFGTRRLRDIYCMQGWLRDVESNIDSILHPETGTKVVFQNAEAPLCRAELPQAASPKGPGSRKLVNAAQGDLFDGWLPAQEAPVGAVYYLFVHLHEGTPTAELSAPRSIGDDNFDSFYERIHLIEPGDDSWSITENIEDDIAEDELVVTVTRK